jgi:apolipoprotein D and lipocalin family protein
VRIQCVLVVSLLLLSACQSVPERPGHVVDDLDLDRFMGQWFVIAHIPLWPERKAWNAVEHYQRLDERRVATTFTFRHGGPEAKVKQYTPVAYTDVGPSPAVWDMQFLWPFRADFRVVWLDEAYRYTIIGRKQRDYAWIMAREPTIPPQVMRRMVDYLEVQGYPMEKLRRVPHSWQGEPGYGEPES